MLLKLMRKLAGNLQAIGQSPAQQPIRLLQANSLQGTHSREIGPSPCRWGSRRLMTFKLAAICRPLCSKPPLFQQSR